LTWRLDLKLFHGERAGEILRPLGFSDQVIERVGQLLRKERLKADPEAQAQSLGYSAQDPWAKMSPQGQAAAFGLDLEEETAALVHRALHG
jgi:hypothetical protein